LTAPKAEKTKRRPSSFLRRHGWKVGVAVGLVAIAVVVALMIANSGGGTPEQPGLAKKTGKGNDPDKKKPVSDANKVYLTDLPMLASVNWPFPRPKGKDKKPPFDKKPPKDGPHERPTVNGKPLAHGLFMHPADEFDERASVSYKLGKRYSEFHAGVTLNDSARDGATPITLYVYGDGELRWKSKEIVDRDKSQYFKVPVKNVDVLRLEATAPGDIGGAHAVWIDPCLTK
jgi:hypothetical protein